jgi:hypothetical protein
MARALDGWARRGRWMIRTGDKGQALARCAPGVVAPGQALRYQLDVTPTRALQVERLEWVLRCVEDLYIRCSGQRGRAHYYKESKTLYAVRGAALAAKET